MIHQRSLSRHTEPFTIPSYLLWWAVTYRVHLLFHFSRNMAGTINFPVFSLAHCSWVKQPALSTFVSWYKLLPAIGTTIDECRQNMEPWIMYKRFNMQSLPGKGRGGWGWGWSGICFLCWSAFIYKAYLSSLLLRVMLQSSLPSFLLMGLSVCYSKQL